MHLKIEVPERVRNCFVSIPVRGARCISYGFHDTETVRVSIPVRGARCITKEAAKYVNGFFVSIPVRGARCIAWEDAYIESMRVSIPVRGARCIMFTLRLWRLLRFNPRKGREMHRITRTC